MNKETTDAETLASIIKDIKFTMMTTAAEDGALYSRPMATLKLDVANFNGRLWFFSKKKSSKNHSIENDQHVNLAYSEPDKNRFISVSGRATISEDKAKMKELWNPFLKAWFPEGIDDPEISLISVDVDCAEIWDSPTSKVVQLLGFFKAAVTGKPIDQNVTSKHIDLH
jgi:general stress protein 26